MIIHMDNSDDNDSINDSMSGWYDGYSNRNLHHKGWISLDNNTYGWYEWIIDTMSGWYGYSDIVLYNTQWSSCK